MESSGVPALADTNLRVWWSTTSASVDCDLQMNSDLATTNWADVVMPVTDDGTNTSVMLPAPATNAFFRLLHP